MRPQLVGWLVLMARLEGLETWWDADANELVRLPVPGPRLDAWAQVEAGDVLGPRRYRSERVEHEEDDAEG